jgi:AraC-like DNA-binding protein
MSIDVRPWWDYPRNDIGVRKFLEVGLEHGLSSDQLLGGTTLDEPALDPSDSVVEAEQELAVARNLVAALGDPPGLGIEAGVRWNVGTAGIVGFAMLASPTLREAISVGLRYATLSSLFVRPRLVEGPDLGGVVLDDHEVPEDVRGMLVERDLSALIQIFPMILGTALELASTRIELNLPGESCRLIGAMVPDVEMTASDRTAFIFPVDWLDRPLPAADPATAELCARQCDELLDRRLRRRGIAASVRSQLVRRPADMPSMREAAAELHLDERTLHRRLASEGTSFRKLEAEVREALAVELLSRNGLTVEEVARRLGYSEVAAFSRAFKRWTGTPPSTVRTVVRG